MVSSDGTPAPVNMHAGTWAVEELGVEGTGRGGGHVTGVMDDQGRASSGVPHTRTKGVASSIGLNKETVEMWQQKMRSEEQVYHSDKEKNLGFKAQSEL